MRYHRFFPPLCLVHCSEEPIGVAPSKFNYASCFEKIDQGITYLATHLLFLLIRIKKPGFVIANTRLILDLLPPPPVQQGGQILKRKTPIGFMLAVVFSNLSHSGHWSTKRRICQDLFFKNGIVEIIF